MDLQHSPEGEIPLVIDYKTEPRTTTSERIKNGVKVAEGFEYASDSNTEWMSIDALRGWITANETKIGAI
mgnify:CR=1 FL=1